MVVVLVILLTLALGVAAGLAFAASTARRSHGADDAALERAVTLLREQAAAERDVAVRAALEQSAVLSRAQLQAGLAESQRERRGPQRNGRKPS